jgi:hypothetical protein
VSSAIAKLFSFCYRRAWLTWLLLIIFTAGMLWLARGLRTDVSAEGLLPQNTPLRARYEEVKKTFGSDHVAAVYIQDPALFSADKLKRLDDLSQKLGQLEINLPLTYTPSEAALEKDPSLIKVKYSSKTRAPADDADTGPFYFKYFRQIEPIERTESLFNTSTIVGDNGMVSTGPLLEPLPDTPEDIAAAKAAALNNPLFVGTLVSKDGTATLITLYLRPDVVNLDGFDQAFAAAVDALVTPETDHFTKIFQIGPPIMHVTLSGYMMADQKRIIPLSCLILMLLIAVMMRSIPGAFAPLLNATFSNIWTLGLMAVLGMPINMLNYVVPALMVIIGATSDVHIMIEFRNQRARGLSAVDAITETGRKLGLSIFLTNITTVLGFASTGLTDVTVLRQFGITAALAMLIRYFATLVVLPPYLRLTERWFRPPPAAAAAAEAATVHAHHAWWDRHLTQPYIRFTMERLVPRLRLVITLCLLACIPLIIFASHIKIDNDFSAFLHSDSSLMLQLDTVAHKLSGTDVIDITFRSDPGEYRNPVPLQQVFKFEQYLRHFPEVGSVIGVPDFIALVNREFHNGDPKQYNIPDNPALLHQYLILFHPSDLKPYATANFSEVNLVLRCDASDSARLNAMVAQMTHALNSGSYGYQAFTITGHAVLSAALVDSIAVGQVLSLGSMALIMLAMIGLVFLSWRAGALSVVANIFPIVAVFGIMGLFGIPLNLGTCMIAGISMGIAMDDTVHLMVRYHSDLRQYKVEKLALIQTLQEEFQPVLLSSLALAGGFLVLATSSFVPVQQFGALSALVMVLAVAAEMLLTPTFLCNTRLITVWDVLDMTLRRALREKSAAFEGLTPWQIKKLLAASNVEDHPAGERVIRSGDQGSRMYIVIEGELEVSRGEDEHRFVLNRLGPGQVIGEVALVARVQRSADVTALTPVKLLTLDWNSLVGLQRFSPYLAARFNLNLARILGLRLADTLGKVDSRAPFTVTRPSFPVPDPNAPASPG